MPTIRIDNREVHVPLGGTILDGARLLGIDVPTLCYRPGPEAMASCLACVVKLDGRIVPSCSTRAVEGMCVESETAEVHRARRTALELLLSDHVGDCRAPCQNICPAGMNIPQMLRQIEAGRLDDAIVTVKKDIALPAVLGYVCHKPCERGCRRASADGCVSVCLLKRFVAEADLESAEPYLPTCKPASGKAVAIVGAGATGLSAAYYLRQAGHGCVLFDSGEAPGGALRYRTGEEQLPRAVLDAECDIIRRLGAELRMGTTVGRDVSPADLQRDFDAVLLAVGTLPHDRARTFDVESCDLGIAIDKRTLQTSVPGVFAAGAAVRSACKAVRAVADGKAAADRIDQYLSAGQVGDPAKPFNVRMAKPTPEELARMVADAGPEPGRYPQGRGFTPDEARVEAARCLHCDCRKNQGCKLRFYGQRYGADPNRFRGPSRRFERHSEHPEVIYESGKCISCGICIRIATEADEELGLSFIGRGFDVRVGVPFNASIAEGLKKVAAACIAACPTGALAPKDQR